MNLIDKDELIEDLKTEFNNLKMNGLKGTPRIKELSFKEIVERIDEQPIIEERKHGHWISLEPEIGLYSCSECEHKILRAKCNYCPNCGAIMGKE